MFSLNMLDYPMSFLSLSTWTWNTFPTLRGTWAFYLNHVLPPRPSKSYGVVECASGYVVMCKRLCGGVCKRLSGYVVECASGYVECASGYVVGSP